MFFPNSLQTFLALFSSFFGDVPIIDHSEMSTN